MTFFIYGLLGLVIAAPLYLLFFGGLEWLIKRDEGSEPPVNSFRAAKERAKKG